MTCFKEYLKKLTGIIRTGDAREESFYPVLADLGQRLVNLHLLCSAELDPPLARFERGGDNRVAKSKKEGLLYDVRTGRVYVNKNQYFAPGPLEVWEYTIGGYQVAAKWLKDRRDR